MTTTELVTPAEVADVLRRAADHIEAVGRYEGTFFQPHWLNPQPFDQRPCCALGAVGYAAGYWIADGMDFDNVPLVGSDLQYIATTLHIQALYETAERVLAFHLGERAGIAAPIHVPSWNDEDTASAAEIAVAMRAAAEDVVALMATVEAALERVA